MAHWKKKRINFKDFYLKLKLKSLNYDWIVIIEI